MASQGNSNSQSSAGSSSLGASVAAALGGVALAGALVASQGVTRSDAAPTHPSAPYQQMAFLPETSEPLMRRIRFHGSSAKPPEEISLKPDRRVMFDMTHAQRYGRGVQPYHQVRSRELVQHVAAR